MIVCHKCGNILQEGLIFCTQCGAKVVDASYNPPWSDEQKKYVPPVAPDVDQFANMPTMPVAPHGLQSPPDAVRPHPARKSSKAPVIILTALAVVLLVGLGAIAALALFGDDSAARQANERQAESRRTPDDNNNNAVAPNVNTRNANIASPTPSPSPTPSAPVNTASAQSEVMAVVNGWAQSLRNQNINEHMKLYASKLTTYYTRNNVGADYVRAERERLFAQYSSINPRPSNISITFDQSGTRAYAVFDNTWSFDSKSGKAQNELDMEKVGGVWLITAEKHLKTYYE
jgi:hypothetical protein